MLNMTARFYTLGKILICPVIALLVEQILYQSSALAPISEIKIIDHLFS